MTVYSFYNNLLKKLNVKDSNNITSHIIHQDFEFYKYYFSLSNKQQEAGGDNVKEIDYEYENYTFKIYQIEEDDRISFSVYNQNNTQSPDICALLFIPKRDYYVYLETISYYTNCNIPSMPKTKGGSLLLNMILQFINDIKSKYKLKYIQLKDNSHFTCNQDNERTPISNLYMLTRCNTWYGKYGFIPFDPVKKGVDIDVLVDYKINQKLIKLIKVKHTHLSDYLTVAINRLNLKEQFSKQTIKKIFDAYNERSIQDFFKDFMKRYDQRCHIFNLIYKEVMNEIGMIDLYGKIYYKTL